MIKYRRSGWIADAIAWIDTYGMTQEEYERTQAKAMIKKMNKEDADASKEAYIHKQQLK